MEPPRISSQEMTQLISKQESSGSVGLWAVGVPGSLAQVARGGLQPLILSAVFCTVLRHGTSASNSVVNHLSSLLVLGSSLREIIIASG